MTNPPPKNTKIWAMLSALLIGTFIGTMGNSIVSIALPSIMDHYSIDISQSVWSITLYTLTFSVLIPVFGSLSRSIGFRRMFTSGMVLVTVSSLFCIFAPNYTVFLISRILIGVGVATILPTIMGIISFYFPKEIQGTATGYWALVNSMGHALGPTIGGFLLNHFSWQSIFWINIPLAMISIAMAVKVFPRDERMINKWFDWPGAVSMAVFVFSSMMAISRVNDFQENFTAVLLLALTAVVSLAFLFFRERRIDNPFVNLRLFTKKDYVGSIVPISLQAFTQFGLLVSLPIYLIEVNGIEKQISGLVIMSMTMMMAITSPFAGRITDRVSSKWVCLAGAIFTGLGAITMTVSKTDHLESWGWFGLIASLMIFGLGFGMIQSGSTVAAIKAAPKEIAGAATGFFHMIRFVSASLGSTIFGIIFEAASGSNLGGFYSSFILIILLALFAIPFILWIETRPALHVSGQV